jgi:uncharacterized membrane protein
MALCAVFLLAAVFFFRDFKGRRYLEGAYGASGLLVPWLLTLVFYELLGTAVFATVALSAIMGAVGAARKRAWLTGAAIASAGLTPIAALPRWSHLASDGFWPTLGLLGAAALMILLARLLPLVRKRLGGDSAFFTGTDAAWWYLGGGACVALFALSKGAVVDAALITPAWGALGGLMLASGLYFPDERSRRIAYAIFGMALFRVFYHDVAALSRTARAVAFFGLGLLMVGASVGYAMFSKRLQDAEEEE